MSVANDTSIPSCLPTPCAPCYITASTSWLEFPYSVVEQPYTVSVVPHITQFPDGSLSTSYSTVSDNRTITLGGNATNTVEYFDSFTWEVSGLTLTYPTTYAKYNQFSGKANEDWKPDQTTTCDQPTEDITSIAIPPRANAASLIFPFDTASHEEPVPIPTPILDYLGSLEEVAQQFENVPLTSCLPAVAVVQPSICTSTVTSATSHCDTTTLTRSNYNGTSLSTRTSCATSVVTEVVTEVEPSAPPMETSQASSSAMTGKGTIKRKTAGSLTTVTGEPIFSSADAAPTPLVGPEDGKGGDKDGDGDGDSSTPALPAQDGDSSSDGGDKGGSESSSGGSNDQQQGDDSKGSSEDSSGDQSGSGSSNQGSSNQDSSDQGSSNQGSSNSGSSDQDSSGSGSSDQGSSNQGSSNQDSSNSGSSNQGSSDQGSSNQDSSNQDSSKQGSSNQGSSNGDSSNSDSSDSGSSSDQSQGQQNGGGDESSENTGTQEGSQQGSNGGDSNGNSGDSTDSESGDADLSNLVSAIQNAASRATASGAEATGGGNSVPQSGDGTDATNSDDTADSQNDDAAGGPIAGGDRTAADGSGSQSTATALPIFTFAGQTLTPGGAATYGGAPVSELPNQNGIVIGSDQTLSLSDGQATTIAQPNQNAIEISRSGSAYIVDGQTLSPGQEVTAGQKTASLGRSAGVLFVDGTPTTLAGPSVTIDGSVYTAAETSASDGLGDYIYSGIGGGASSDEGSSGGAVSETGAAPFEGGGSRVMGLGGFGWVVAFVGFWVV